MEEGREGRKTRAFNDRKNEVERRRGLLKKKQRKDAAKRVGAIAVAGISVSLWVLLFLFVQVICFPLFVVCSAATTRSEAGLACRNASRRGRWCWPLCFCLCDCTGEMKKKGE